KTVAEIRKLEAAGCEIVRVSVKDLEDARAIRAVKKRSRVPIVCDIHFDYRLALAAIEAGVDKVRLNPGNIWKRCEIAQVVKAARRAKIPIRVGVNSGSAGSSAPSSLVKAATGFIKILEELGFRDIIISLKASDVVSTVEAYRKISDLCDYPLHLGVTAAGPFDSGIVKSSIGIGSLLLDGIGDTIRVSLTADPVQEVIAAKRILGALGLRNFGPDIISCPTCGRCQVDLATVVKKAEKAISAIRFPLSTKRHISIAIMGCEVNGPGEAQDADIGIAAGRGYGALFVKGKIVRRVKEKDFVKEILRQIKKLRVINY
ncbi:MAG: flavodoxin-dependent (E)-4-hydroxy-3-methylbut-2-enyl-diphosphate synthase, partial [Candidatus Omnitrophica bacterium]|nr:flavodoxin-dependent (E)-4-hydroxy-3-methylbut-2-enyl-diphosphate synthase [Candidatus Omnitrophota bacterium]